MRISLWQQFSGNHSSHFWVAGTFQTVDDADQAYKALHDVLVTIFEWHRNHPEESRAIGTNNEQRPSPIEIEIIQKYNVKWERTLDWMNIAYYLPPHELDYTLGWALKVVGQTIIMTNPSETWGVNPLRNF